MLFNYKNLNPVTVSTLLLGTLLSVPAFAQPAERYALLLADPPVSARYSSRDAMETPEALTYRRQIETGQATLTRELEGRRFTIAGSSSLLVNAVFVIASPGSAAELATLPGVTAVVRLRKFERTLNQATQLLNGSAAWGLLGGMSNAGKGMKIGIIDTGIDQNHPSMQDTTLTLPAGFPKCNTASDCTNFTNTKVIVARSYIRQLAVGTGTINPATSGPDDYSARDRSGHGTATATCAAGNTSTGTVTINGMAPKAWVGSYKVFGSPEANDATTEDVLIQALTDAMADGMDVVSMSVGVPALTGPLDTGASCGLAAGVPCDLIASAFERLATMQGAPVVLVAAGNQGDAALGYPNFNSITSPADAPSVIAVGGTSNSHGFNPGVRISGQNVPANLKLIPGQNTDDAYANGGSQPAGAFAAPLFDITALGDTGFACSSLPSDLFLGDSGLNSQLYGKIALVQAGNVNDPCDFATQEQNVLIAGAFGVIFYDTAGDSTYPFNPQGLSGFGWPAVFIANSDGVSLKTFIDANPGFVVTIDPAVAETPVSPFNQLVSYSSVGPSLGANGIKPDLLSVAAGGLNGDLLYTAAQSYDPLGDVYSPTGFIAAAGTSFATPLAAGVAAMVKQAHPGYTAAQIKSALVDTATQDVTSDDSGDSVNILQTGAGKVAADLAVKTTVTVVPSTLSYGLLTGSAVAQSIALTITNTASVGQTLTLAVASTVASTTAKVTLDKSTVTLAAGASSVVNAALSGTIPGAGLYFGAITVAGGSVPLRVPYMFLVGSTISANYMPIGGNYDVVVGQPFPSPGVAFQITDANGIPISGAAVNFKVNTGTGVVPVALGQVSAKTDGYGIAYAAVTAGGQPGSYSIEGCLGACSTRNQFEFSYTGNIRNIPAICKPGDPAPCNGTGIGVVNAASANANTPIAPGSYFSIYGTNLSDIADTTTTAALPMSIDFVNVSFDVPSAGISVPAYLDFVSAGQINAQVPWELQGQTSAQVKVTIDGDPGNVVTVPIANYAPAFFEIGAGIVAAIDPLNASNPVITATNPATRGKVVSLYANGLGPVSNQPASGAAASLTVLAQTPVNPTVTIGGQPAVVGFSGLTPGLPGLYQINVTVPANIGTGSQPVTLSIGGAAAKASSITVK